MLLLGCNMVGLRHIAFYLSIGFLLWICILQSGIHGTVTGVLIAATVPARPRYGRGWFVRNTRHLIGHLEGLRRHRRDVGILSDLDQHATVEAVEDAVKSATTPLRRWERALERPVLLCVLPIFALTNAGIPLSPSLLDNAVHSPITWGILCGLLLGKVLGISLLTWLTLRSGVGRLGEAMTMQHVVGVALLGGMGFTMSVFIAGLSFSSEIDLHLAKLAILVTSALAGIAGFLWLRFVAR
jgi:NhaA family Na+:H+ antiporter